MTFVENHYMLTVILTAMLGVFIGFVLCSILTNNSDRRNGGADAERLNFIASAPVTLTQVNGFYAVLRVGEQHLPLAMSPSLRSAIDAAREKFREQQADDSLETQFMPEEKANG